MELCDCHSTELRREDCLLCRTGRRLRHTLARARATQPSWYEEARGTGSAEISGPSVHEAFKSVVEILLSARQECEVGWP